MKNVMTYLVILAMLFAVSGCMGKANPWLDEGEYDQLKQKITFDKKAIIRYQQAEASALQEGDQEGASAYQAARESLQAEMPRLEERFAVLEAERQERLKMQQEHFMNDD